MARGVPLRRPCVNHPVYSGRPASACPHCGAEDDMRIPLKPKLNFNRGNGRPAFFAMEMPQFTKLWRDAVLKETSSYVKAWLDSVPDSEICSRYGTSTFQVRTQRADSHGVENVPVPVSVSWDANSDSDDGFSRSYVYLEDSHARIDDGGRTDLGADGRPSFDYERTNSNTRDRTSSASTATNSGSYGQLIGHLDNPCPHCGAEDDIRIPLTPKLSINRGNGRPAFSAMELSKFTKLWSDAVLKETSSYVKAWLDSVPDSEICSRYGMSTFQVRTQGTDSHGVENVPVPVSVSWDANSDPDDEFSRSYVYLGDSDARIDGGGRINPGANGRPSFDYERTNSNSGDRISSSSMATNSGSYLQLPSHLDSLTLRMVSGGTRWFDSPTHDPHTAFRGPMYTANPGFSQTSSAAGTAMHAGFLPMESPRDPISRRYIANHPALASYRTMPSGPHRVPSAGPGSTYSIPGTVPSVAPNFWSDNSEGMNPMALAMPRRNFLPHTVPPVGSGSQTIETLVPERPTHFYNRSGIDPLSDHERISGSGTTHPAADGVTSGGSSSSTQPLHTSSGGAPSGSGLATDVSNSVLYVSNMYFNSAPNAAFSTGSRGVDSVPPSAAFGMRQTGSSGQANSVHESVRYAAPRSTYLTDRVVQTGYPHGPYHTHYEFGDVSISEPFNPYTWTWAYPTPYHHGSVPPYNHVHENRAPGPPNNEGQAHNASVSPHNHEHMQHLPALSQANGPTLHISAPVETPGHEHRINALSQTSEQAHVVPASSQIQGQTHDVSAPSQVYEQIHHGSAPSQVYGQIHHGSAPSHVYGQVHNGSAPSQLYGQVHPGSAPSQVYGLVHQGSAPSQVYGQVHHGSAPSQVYGQVHHGSAPSQVYGQVHHGSAPSHVYGQIHHGSAPSHVYGQVHNGSAPSQLYGQVHPGSAPSQVYGLVHQGSAPSQVYGQVHHGSAPSQVYGQVHHGSAPSQVYGQVHHGSAPSQVYGQVHHGSAPSQIQGQTHDVSAPSQLYGQAHHSYAPTHTPRITYHSLSYEDILEQTWHAWHEHQRQLVLSRQRATLIWDDFFYDREPSILSSIPQFHGPWIECYDTDDDMVDDATFTDDSSEYDYDFDSTDVGPAEAPRNGPYDHTPIHFTTALEQGGHTIRLMLDMNGTIATMRYNSDTMRDMILEAQNLVVAMELLDDMQMLPELLDEYRVEEGLFEEEREQFRREEEEEVPCQDSRWMKSEWFRRRLPLPIYKLWIRPLLRNRTRSRRIDSRLYK